MALQDSPQRVPPLEGSCNFRDLGGYATTDGHQTRWHRLFRSGEMTRLTDADHIQLGAVGLRAVCDLRCCAERQTSPTAWQRIPGVRYWSRPYEQSLGELHRLMGSTTATVEEAIQVMSAVYRQLPFEQAPAYRELFSMLAAGEVPLAFNCTAGKDRTGVAAALVLMAVGVPYETVLADYQLSNQTFDYRSSARRANSMLSAEVIAALGGTHPTYLDQACCAISSVHGSIAGYLHDGLGVTDVMLERIKLQLLE